MKLRRSTTLQVLAIVVGAALAVWLGVTSPLVLVTAAVMLPPIWFASRPRRRRGRNRSLGRDILATGGFAAGLWIAMRIVFSLVEGTEETPTAAESSTPMMIAAMSSDSFLIAGILSVIALCLVWYGVRALVRHRRAHRSSGRKRSATSGSGGPAAGASS